MRHATIHRETRETRIDVSWNLDLHGAADVKSGSSFLDHMLEQLGHHSGTTLYVRCEGDTHIDLHHSVEDLGITLGQALRHSVGDKRGIERYGFYMVAMDECLARCVLDLSGRFHLEYHCPIGRDSVGGLDVELVEHFFRSLAEHAGMTLHLELLRTGNAHHAIEGMFKAFARSLAMAIGPSRTAQNGIPSTKGTL